MARNSWPSISNINNLRFSIWKNKCATKSSKSWTGDIDKTYLYANDPYEAKYQLLINKREITGLKHFNDSKAFIEYSNDIDDIYENIKEYNPNKKRKILIVFDDMIADMVSNKNLNPITAWKVPKYGVISGPYFPVFRLNTEKYGAEITPYLDTFQVVNTTQKSRRFNFCMLIFVYKTFLKRI